MKYFLKRILESAVSLIIISFFSFAVIQLAPGDVSSMYINQDMTQEEIQATIEKLGLDKSIPEQYFAWAKMAVKGDFGVSMINHRPVGQQIMEKFPSTILLMGVSLVVSLGLAIVLGLVAGLKKNTFIDRIINFFTYLGISVPAFWLGMVLIVVFSLKLNMLPSSGMHTVGNKSFIDLVQHLILPTLTLSVGNLAVFTKYIRSNTITQLDEEYVVTAISKGTSRTKVLFRHVFKNCLLPIITLVGMNLSSLVVGSFIIESIFGWPGLGTLGMTAITSRDYTMIMAYTMFSGTLYVLGNLLADVLYSVVDPRIKLGSR
ncbi:peptide/nickel transport system permease protein [Clostridium collagenovorans DSM 3089]|uniref:Peptide/nickel transport system permease protein n=1 Tax=Clostridium collagenovorans DSM 3089 TaxID=1121306 RepID=A0A1M5WLT1_9CLOT|nr:ABC transporter permease [Clostridium collagenovorans]SHH88550.1 peptide/nickel transport system permease protein [Clostridium collagenovorans DSM 3089]